MKTLKELHSLYLAAQRTSLKRLAQTTQKNYRSRQEAFLKHLGPEAYLTALTRPNIARYLLKVSQSLQSGGNMHYFALVHFCNWLVREDWLTVSPMEDIPAPKAKQGRREAVPDDLVARLWEASERVYRSPYKCALARAVLSLLIYGGLRRAECLSIRLEDVRLETGEVFIRHGKGDKSRPIYLCKEGRDALRAYVKVRPKTHQERLLVQSEALPVGYNYVQALLADLHRVAGLTQVYTAHQLRHSYASRLHHNGAPLAAIQKALGHSCLETTARYIHCGIEQVKAIADLASLTPPVEPKRDPGRKRVSLRRAA